MVTKAKKRWFLEAPKVRLAKDWQSKIGLLPIQCWWAEEDEPCYEIPEGSGHLYPYHVAAHYGLIEPIFGVIGNEALEEKPAD